MKLFLLLFILQGFALHSLASTFVGNGGQGTDLPMQVALREIQETYQLIDKNKTDPDLKLCQCYSHLQGHVVCSMLQTLSAQQQKFCSEAILKNANALKNVAQKLSRQGFKWTTEAIEVNEGGLLRSVDAVTDSERGLVTIQQSRFLDMPDYERVFLLAHEMGHLHQWDGQSIRDNQSVGPFTGAEGGREFLNAVAAATAMEALDYKVMAKYHGALHRSQAYKTHWIELAATSEVAAKKSYVVDSKRGTLGSYRFQFNDKWGLQFEARTSEGESNFFVNAKGRESVQGYALLAAYRYFPFADPMTALGQSHLVFLGGLESMRGSYSLSDSHVSTSAEAQSLAARYALGYYWPLQQGFWLHLKVGNSMHRYSYSLPYLQVQVESLVQYNFGVSYAF